MKSVDSNHCPRCGQRVLAPTETAERSRGHTVQICDGRLYVRCQTRQCGLWFRASPRLLALLRAVVVPEAEPCWKE